MKKINGYLSILIFTLLTPAAYADNSDPFIKTWFYSDGFSTYQLDISKSRAPGQGYRVSFNTPGYQFKSDLCNATSGSTIECITNVQLTRDDAKHLITVKQGTEYFKYYEANYLPALPGLIGTWKATAAGMSHTHSWTLVIRSSADPTEILIDTSAEFDNVASCSSHTNDIFTGTTNPDGTQTFTHKRKSSYPDYPELYPEGFTYDPAKQEITKIPNKYNQFSLNCVSTGLNPVFKKDL